MVTDSARYRYYLLFLLLIALFYTPAITGASENQDNKPFLTSSTSNTHPFVGQEILLTYTLYFRDIAPKISSEKNPSFQGLWAKENVPDRFIKSIQTTIQGEHFRSAVVKQFRLVPIQSGMITVSGYKMQCVLPPPNMTTGGKELSDSHIQITAPALVISARALPEPVPEGFSGAVGNFSLEVHADKLNLRIGEPLSLTLKLTGAGSLYTLELPNLHLPESFRQNPPERTTTLKKESELTSGSITSTLIAWPQSEGDFQIPAQRLVAFNPETRQFSTLLSKPLTITVTRAQEAMMSEEKPSDTALGKKINFFPLLIGAILIIVLLITGISFVLRNKHQKDTNTALDNTAGLRSDSDNSAGKMKQKLLTALEKAGINSPGCLTREELKQALQEINITDETQTELPGVLDSLDKIIYSPSEKKETRLPEGMVAKINALVHELIKSGGSR